MSFTKAYRVDGWPNELLNRPFRPNAFHDTDVVFFFGIFLRPFLANDSKPYGESRFCERLKPSQVRHAVANVSNL